MKTTFIAIVAGSMLSHSALSAEAPKKLDLPISKEIQSVGKQDQSTVKNATRLMAHLSFAAQAIDLGLKKSALENLGEAKKLCATIEKSRPEVISKYEYKFGKATYTVAGVARDYYVPVADDVFVDGRFDEKAIWKKNPKVEENGLAIVHSKLQLNMKDVAAAIQSAEKSTKVEKYDDARKALEGVFKDAIRTEEVVTNPVWTVMGNLNLAQEFLKGGHKSVRYALNAAKSDLQKLEKDSVLTKSGPEVKELSAEIEKIEKNLDEKDPSMAKRVGARLSAWETKVKAWF